MLKVGFQILLLPKFKNYMKDLIERAWKDRTLLKDENTIAAIRKVIDEIDNGRLRCAEPLANGTWQVNQWLKKAVLLYFRIEDNSFIKGGFTNYFDKIYFCQFLHSALKLKIYIFKDHPWSMY